MVTLSEHKQRKPSIVSYLAVAGYAISLTAYVVKMP